MDKLISNVSNSLIRALVEVLKIFLYGITVIGFMNGSLNLERVLLVCLLNYLASYLISYIITKSSTSRSKSRIGLLIIALVCSLLSVVFLNDGSSVATNLLICLLYFVSWKKGSDIFIEEYDLDFFKSSFIISFILFFIINLLVMFISGVLPWYLDILKFYGAIYLLLSILFMARLSMASAYNEKSKNVINKSKNITTFNRMSTAITVLLIVLLATRLFGLGNSNFIQTALSFVFNNVGELLSIILYPVALVMAKILEFIDSKIGNILSQFWLLMSQQNMDTEGQGIEGIVPSDGSPIVDNLIVMLQWMIIIAIIGFVAYKFYRNLKEMYMSEMADKDAEGEEKDFILTTDDIKKGLLKPFRNLYDGLSNLFSNKNRDLRELHPIRRNYIEILLKLDEIGYVFNKSYTPNEFAESIDDNRVNSLGFERLTDCYNKVRYGLKNVSQKEIEESINIKNKIQDIK